MAPADFRRLTALLCGCAPQDLGLASILSVNFFTVQLTDGQHVAFSFPWSTHALELELEYGTIAG